MGGLILYLLTLALEMISVVVRFALVAALGTLVFGQQTGLLLGTIAGLYPIAYSLAALAGLPRGHLLTRIQQRGRRLTAEEQQRLDAALERPRALGVPIPRHIFAIDRDGLNAFVAGRTLYIYRDLLYHPCLPGVLAHELGHHNSLDGRLSGAIFGLTLPGGFLLTFLLLSVLQWIAYGAVLLLIGLVVIIFMVLGLQVGRLLGTIFSATVNVTRFLIIFAVGGVGTALLRSLWRAYYVEREYAADAYAGRLGYAQQLMRFFEHEVLSDVAIPWYTQPSHPPTSRRLEALRLHALRQPQVASEPEGWGTAPQPRQRHSATANAMRQRRSGSYGAAATATAPPWLLIVTLLAGLLGSMLLVAALLTSDAPSPAQRLAPTAPTPTLGIAP